MPVQDMKPLCTMCESPWHYKTFCPLMTKKAIRKRNPIRVMGKQTKKWIETRKLWFKLNPAESYECYICGKYLEKNETTLDHVIPRSRAPHLRYEMSNLKPCCAICNTEKGSKVYE